MLDVLWHLRGSVALDGTVSDQAALERIERLLERQRKPIGDRGPDYLSFDAPLWSDIWGPNWRALMIYDAGRVWIEQGLGGRTLRYDLRSLHGLVFCLFGAATFFLLGFLGGGIVDALTLAALVLGWVYGMNVLTAWLRVPRLIKKAVRRLASAFLPLRTLGFSATVAS